MILDATESAMNDICAEKFREMLYRDRLSKSTKRSPTCEIASIYFSYWSVTRNASYGSGNRWIGKGSRCGKVHIKGRVFVYRAGTRIIDAESFLVSMWGGKENVWLISILIRKIFNIYDAAWNYERSPSSSHTHTHTWFIQLKLAYILKTGDFEPTWCQQFCVVVHNCLITLLLM